MVWAGIGVPRIGAEFVIVRVKDEVEDAGKGSDTVRAMV